MDEVFKSGDHVQVVQSPIAPKEVEYLVGKHGLFTGYSRSQRYAIVSFPGVDMTLDCMVHPENLQPSSSLVQVTRDVLVRMSLYQTTVILGVFVRKADSNLFESVGWTEPYDADKAAKMLAG